MEIRIGLYAYDMPVKQIQYLEGQEATENFEQAMKILFRPKVRSKKKQQKDKPTAASRKPKTEDKD